MKTAILLSGGIDSTSLAFWVRPEVAITIDYGQLAADGEVRASKEISRILKMEHEIVGIDCRSLGSGDMAAAAPSQFAPVPEWWPFRNQLLITLASMRAISIGVDRILIGSVEQDGVHADGKKEFFTNADRLVSSQEGHIRVEAPAIDLSSVDLVRRSKIGIETLAWTHSCHTGEYACGECRGCIKHQNVMKELGYEIY